MPKKVLQTKEGKPSSSPLSAGIQMGNTVFVSGQVALDGERQVVGRGDVRAQTRFVIEKIRQVLAEAGMMLDDVVSTTVYLPNVSDFRAMNEVYSEMFKSEFPARATVRADLMADGLLVEISAIAMR